MEHFPLRCWTGHTNISLRENKDSPLERRNVFLLAGRVILLADQLFARICLSNIQLDMLSNKVWKIGNINQSAKDRAGEALKKSKFTLDKHKIAHK